MGKIVALHFIGQRSTTVRNKKPGCLHNRAWWKLLKIKEHFEKPEKLK